MNQLRPLSDLRRFNRERQVLFDWTIIRFIVWDLFADEVASQASITSKLELVTKWYSVCAKQPKLRKLTFPWGSEDDMTGSLQAPKNYDLRTNYNINVSKPPTISCRKKVVVIEEEEEETKKQEEEDEEENVQIIDEENVQIIDEEKDAWHNVPCILRDLFDKNNISKKKINTEMRTRNFACGPESICNEDIDSKITFFYDFARGDWAIVLRIGAVYEDRLQDIYESTNISTVKTLFFK